MIQIGNARKIEEYCPEWEKLNEEWMKKYPYNEYHFWRCLRYINGKKSFISEIKGKPISQNINAVVMVCPRCGARLFYPYLNIWGGWGYSVDDDATVYFEEEPKRIKTTLFDMNEPSEEYILGLKEARVKLDDLVKQVRNDNKPALNYPTEGSCPICGNKGMSASSIVKLGKVEDIYDGKAITRLKEEFEKLQKRVADSTECSEEKIGKAECESFIRECNQSVKGADEPGEKIENVDLLKGYLKSLIDIEMSIMACEKRLQQLFPLSFRTNASIHCFNREDYVSGRIAFIKQTMGKLSDENILRSEAFIYGIHVPYIPEQPVEPVYKQAGFFNRKKIDEENELARKAYQTQLAAYQSALEADSIFKREAKKIIIQKLDEELRVLQSSTGLTISEEQRGLDCINSELEDAKEIYKRLIDTRALLYGKGIIFSKYRDVVSISTMYEYIMSGRCVELEGPNGTYNLLESEIRANAILTKLDTVIAKLEDIQQGQFVLFTELRKINSKLDGVSKTMRDVLASLRGIEKTNAAIAYATQKTAFYAEMISAIEAANFFLK